MEPKKLTYSTRVHDHDDEHDNRENHDNRCFNNCDNHDNDCRNCWKSSCVCRLLSDLDKSVYKDADDNASWQDGSFFSFPASYICGYFLSSGQLWVKIICVNTKLIKNTVNNSSKIAQRRLWKLVKWVLMTLNSKNTIPYTHPDEKFCSKGNWFQNIFFLIQLSFALPIRAERC